MATHDDVDEPTRERPLHESRRAVTRVWNNRDTVLGSSMILSYAVFSLLLVVVTVERTGNVPAWLPGQPVVGSAVQVPPAVYVFAALGACGYVFTRLIREFEDTLADFSLTEALKMLTTVLAAIPLSAGIFLLSGFLFDATISGSTGAQAGLSPETQAGVAFLTGLFVKRAYQRLGWVADKLLPTGEQAGQVDIGPLRTDTDDSDGEAETDDDAVSKAGDGSEGTTEPKAESDSEAQAEPEARSDSDTDTQSQPEGVAGDGDGAGSGAADDSGEESGDEADGADRPTPSQ